MAKVALSRWVLALLAAASPALSTPSVLRDVFGDLSGRPVYRYTLSAEAAGVTVKVIEYGAALTSVRAPDRSGRVEDVLLGFDTIDGYLGENNPHFGGTIGRVANRVSNAAFTLDGVTFHLDPNDGKNSIHGGKWGFDKRHWSSRVDDGRVVMQYVSGVGDGGYPGEVTVTVAYWLEEDGTLCIEYNATSTKRTPINLTNHGYFNLAGHNKGAAALSEHTVMIDSDYITAVDDDFIPNGTLTALEGTPLSLRPAKKLGEVIPLTKINGFDFNYVLKNNSLASSALPVAIVEHPASGRKMEMTTTQFGVQFYTSNMLKGVVGKDGAQYGVHAALCLEAQNWPDAINRKEFPNSVYGPGDFYHQITKYKFSVTEKSASQSINFLSFNIYLVLSLSLILNKLV